MNHFKFFVYQFVLTSAFLAGNYYFDEYISKPFDRDDLLATSIFAFLIILIFNVMNRLYARLIPIHLINKILLSILAFIFAALSIGLLTGELIF
ncbi:hypothetical protein NLX67_18595 [Domibacillus sp. A3M-37]|uniref:hypothetical protein n=1 Tax=Domibacillus sp. A3M-37 TaxID=2962037 RepID=UPI0020B6CA3F|nr:hypothetical protein [Domibacillus sp. A3M-37]MCP3764358.1 hypothetical protein [Domibacillus sp. A3M-37]